MTKQELIEILIESDGPVNIEALLDEATVYLPRRSSRWVATFRDETGRQVWRSTGLRDKVAALAQARQWEAEAKRRRAAQGVGPRKAAIRVRRRSGEEATGPMTQEEVAVALRISQRAVREIERTALQKLRRHPALKELWREWTGGEVAETGVGAPKAWTLTGLEIAALYGLAWNTQERRVIRKLLTLTQAAPWLG